MSWRSMRLGATYAILGAWSFICLFPIYWLVTVSLKSGAPDTRGYLPFVDFTPNLEAWRYILFDRSDNFVPQLLNSIIIALAATALTLACAILAVYGLTRLIQAGGDQIAGLLLASRIIPPVAIAVPLYILAQHVDLLGTRSLLILVYGAVNLPAALWLLRPIMGSKASLVEEAARLDGASHWRIIREIIVPSAAMGLGAAGVVVFILCWNEYLLAAVLGGSDAMTVPSFLAGQLSIKEAQASFESEELARFSAAAMLVGVPALLLAGAVQRALSRPARQIQVQDQEKANKGQKKNH